MKTKCGPCPGVPSGIATPLAQKRDRMRFKKSQTELSVFS